MTDYAKDLLPDQTQITARLHDDVCAIEAFGIQSGLSDVAEQLLWVSTALRKPASTASAMTLHSAKLIPQIFPDREIPYLDKECYQRCLGKVAFRVEYTATPLPEGQQSAGGGCWMELFRSCPVVMGYPIPSREPRRPGLELPLDIMASLIGADRVTPFGHDLIMKGYSDLLFATECHEGFIMWHLICNERESGSWTSRISFADTRIPRPADHELSHVRPGDVFDHRHIVGWTSTVRLNAGQSVARIARIIFSLTASIWQGAPDVEYSSITSSGLDPPPQGWALDRIQITAGQYMTIGAGFVRGKKQKPIHVMEDDYVLRLLDIRRTRFVLCDVENNKLWLIDGLSTLLHLVRSHLAYAENDEIHQTVLTIKACDLEAKGGRSGPKAAFETLRCDSNRALRLHHKGGPIQTGTSEGEDKDYYRLEDLVKSILHVLEQIVDHQSDFRFEEASVGYRIKRAPWNRLEGFDFMDVANGRRKLSSRATSLSADGKGWVQLTRLLEAPTLFGKRFGEMLEPATISQHSSGCSVCHWNVTMPPGRDLLAAQVEDLVNAGREDGTRVCFTNGLCLDMPPVLFEPCVAGCKENDRIRKLQRAPESHMLAHIPIGLLAKADTLRTKLTGGEAKAGNGESLTGGNGEIQSGSRPSIPSGGAILLGMPQESSDSYSHFSQTFRQYLTRPYGHSVKPVSYINDPQVEASSSQSTDAVMDISDVGDYSAHTESTRPTHRSSPRDLPDSVGNLNSPGSSTFDSPQPSQDDEHRRKRARRRAEEREHQCQV